MSFQFSVFSFQLFRSMALQTFENLEVWKRGCRQAVELIKETSKLQPLSLRDQLQRAAISVPSNIAEGHERDSKLDFMRFLRIAKGSNGDLRTQLYIAEKLDQIGKARIRTAVKESREIGAMLQGLINSIRKSGTPKQTKV